MKQVAPNIYRYDTKKGRRYAVRLALYGRDTWTKGLMSLEQAETLRDATRFEAVQAKHLPQFQPAPALKDYVPHWLGDCELRGLRPTTLRSYRQNLDDHILPALGDLTLDAIIRQDITAFLKKKQRELWGKSTDTKEEKIRTYSPNALRLMLAPLSRLFSDAYDAGLVQHNPCLRPGRIVQVRKRRREPVPYTAEQQAAILTTCQARWPEHYAHVATLFLAGLRPGEAIALEPADVQLTRDRIRISKTFTEGRLHDTPKTGQARYVDIQPNLRPILEAYLKKQTKGKSLFPNEAGGYLDASNWRRRVWNTIMKAAKVPTHSPYAARHTFATRMLEQGRSLAWLQIQMGHSSIAVTVDVYGHLADRI